MADIGPETRTKEVVHGYLPAALAAIALIVALRLDFTHVGCNRAEVCHWTMRCSSVITALGVYVAFRSAFVLVIVKADRARGVNFNLSYGWISAVMLICGSLIWGFADIWL